MVEFNFKVNVKFFLFNKTEDSLFFNTRVTNMTFEKFKCNYFNSKYKTEETLKYCV